MMIEEAEEVLKRRFGFSGLREGQKKVISAVLEGKSVLGIMPTGYGKSICFQLPALIEDGITLVISPLLALIKDQIDGLKRKGITEADAIHSLMSDDEKHRVVRRMRRGELKLLYITPERFEVKSFVDELRKVKIARVVVDEAHCVSRWGRTFRPAYLKLKEHFKHLGIERISAFTATAGPRVRKDIINLLGMKSPEVLVFGFDRPNIFLEVVKTTSRMRSVIKRVREEKGTGIVFTYSRYDAEMLAYYLKSTGEKVEFYHAGMDKEKRKEIQNAFMRGDLRVIVSTSAFGMGVDKPDIRFVFHYDLSPSIESYHQEIGRAGRDGKPSKAVLFYSDESADTIKLLIRSTFPDFDLIKKAKKMLELGRSERAVWEELKAMRITDRTIESVFDYLDRNEMRVEKKQWQIEKELAEEELEAMLGYVFMDKCRRKYILEYFGEVELETSVDPKECCDLCAGIFYGDRKTYALVSELERKYKLSRIRSAEILNGIKKVWFFPYSGVLRGTPVDDIVYCDYEKD